jgi:hypothetical protein
MSTKNLQRGLANIKRRLSVYFGYAFTYLMKTMYHGGIPLSIVYGKFNKLLFDLTNLFYRFSRYLN